MKKEGDYFGLVPQKLKILALDVFRLIRPFSRVKIESADSGYI